MGAVRLPKIPVLTIDDSLSAQSRVSEEDKKLLASLTGVAAGSNQSRQYEERGWGSRRTWLGRGTEVENRQAPARPPAQTASWSVRRALLTPQVNPGSLYRCG